MRRPSPGDWGLLCLLGLIWGAAFPGVKLALTDFSPLWLAALRIALGALVLLPVALFGPGLPPLRGTGAGRVWLHAAGMAVFSNALPFALLAWAQLHVTSAFAGLSMAFVPLLVLPLSHVFVPGERMTALRTAGFALGFLGALVLIGPGVLGEVGGDGMTVLGQFLCIAAAASYALGAIVTRLCPPVPQRALSAAALIVASFASIALAAFLEGPPPVPGPRGLAGILYLGLFSTGLATVILVTLIRRAGPPFLSLVNYQVPVWAVLIGAVALGEAVRPEFGLALVLVLAGLGLAEIGARRKRARG